MSLPPLSIHYLVHMYSINEVFQIQLGLLDHLVHALKLTTKARIRIHQQQTKHGTKSHAHMSKTYFR